MPSEGIVISGDTIEGLPVSAGIFTGILDSVMSRLLKSVKFDYKKISGKELKLAVDAAAKGFDECLFHSGEALKPAVEVFLDADDKAIDKAIEYEKLGMKKVVDLLHERIDETWAPGGGFAAEKALGQDDVQNYLDMMAATEKAFTGANAAPSFNQASVNLLKANPEVIRLLEKAPRSRQLKALSDDSFMQKVIDFFYKYGPYLAQILSFMLLFI